MFCSYCGQQLPSDANFCYKCGKATPSNTTSKQPQREQWDFCKIVERGRTLWHNPPGLFRSYAEGEQEYWYEAEVNTPEGTTYCAGKSTSWKNVYHKPDSNGNRSYETENPYQIREALYMQLIRDGWEDYNGLLRRRVTDRSE